MQYSLVVSDMDGTLLRDDKSISARSVEAIRRFGAAGGHFTLATGRGVVSTAPYVQALGLTTPMVLLNGCLVYDPVTDQDIYVRRMPIAIAERLWPILTAHDIDIVVHSTRQAFVRAVNARIAEHLGHDGITAEVIPDFNPSNTKDLVKILTIGEAGALDDCEAAIRLQGIPVEMVRSHPNYLELLPQGAGKGSGLEALLAHLGLPRERSLCLGDYLNDLDLFTTAGLGVAMANAHPTIKGLAGRWTASNMEDGVARVLEELVEGRPVGVDPAEAASA